MLFRGIRSSKFKHVYGSAVKKEKCYDNVAITKNAHDCSQFCAVNPKFVAVVTEASGGGSFVVIPIELTGRQDVDTGRVTGHRGPVLDVKWSPFNDNLIASASEDATIKIWYIPDHGPPRRGIQDSLVTLAEHKRRVSMIEWHPVAENILISAGFDCLVMIWHTSKAYLISIINCHPDTIQSISLNRSGNLLATTCKDKVLRVIDLREGLVKSEGIAHEGPKSTKVVFLGDSGKLFSTGFSRYSDRQWAVWDINDLSLPLRLENIDSSSGVLFPFYDADTQMVYVAGKGDGSIRYYEITQHPPFCYYINQFMTGYPQRGLGIMPKRGLDTHLNEVFRVYKLHATKPAVEPISFIVPRKSQVFQDDLYPDTAAPTPALTAEEWISGKNRSPILMSMRHTPAEVVKTNKLIMYNRAFNQHDATVTSNHNISNQQIQKNHVNSRSKSAKDFWKSANNLSSTFTGGYNGQHPANRGLITPFSRYRDSDDPSERRRNPADGYSVMSSSINNDRKFAFLRQVEPIDYRPKIGPRSDSQEVLIHKSATMSGALMTRSRDSSSASSSDSGSNNAPSPVAECNVVDCYAPTVASRFPRGSGELTSSHHVPSPRRSETFTHQPINHVNPVYEPRSIQSHDPSPSLCSSGSESQPPSPKSRQMNQSAELRSYLPHEKLHQNQKNLQNAQETLDHNETTGETNKANISTRSVDEFIAAYSIDNASPAGRTQRNTSSEIIHHERPSGRRNNWPPSDHSNAKSPIHLRRSHSLKFTGWPSDSAANSDSEYLAFINRRSSFHSGNNHNRNNRPTSGSVSNNTAHGPVHSCTSSSPPRIFSVNHPPQRQFPGASRFTIPRKPSDIKFKKCRSAVNLLDMSISDDDTDSHLRRPVSANASTGRYDHNNQLNNNERHSIELTKAREEIERLQQIVREKDCKIRDLEATIERMTIEKMSDNTSD